MATISSAGIGSSLPVDDIISKLMSLERRPVAQLQTQASAIQTKISAFGALQSALATFRDASLNLTKATTWGVTSAASSDAASVKVTSTAGAVAGNYAISVTALASSHAAVSRTYESSASLVGEGNLRVEIGSFGQAGFAPQPNLEAMNISITATDSLATVRDKINAAGAGVSAVIVNDVTGARIIISSTNPGSANVFRLTPEGDAGLADLGFDPDAASNPMTQTQSATDALLNINGVDITSSSNNLTNTVDGLSINLLKTTTGTVQMSVAQDTEAVKASILGFVEAYNAVANMLQTQTKYDSATKTAGKLQGDSTAVSLQRQLRGMLGGKSEAGSVFSSINDIGLTTQSDGTIKVNDSKLAAALGNLSEVKKLFSATDNAATDTIDEGGVAQRLRMFGDAVLGAEGALTTRTTGLNTSLTLNKKRQDEFTSRMALTEARLRAQYTALDTSMAKLNALDSYISNQVAAWNKSPR